MTTDHPPVPRDESWPWTALRAHTAARIGLERSGTSLTTSESLSLQLAHAAAHDAIHTALDVPSLRADIARFGLASLAVRSAATNRAAYIRRPDLGRALDPTSTNALRDTAAAVGCDAVFILADGLSALAVQRHAVPVLERVHTRLADPGWRLAPVIVAEQARVAISDPIGMALKASLAVILIGERPGLSSSDSLGVYVTWNPQPGRSDAERNCISNIHARGLSYEDAADQLVALLMAARSQATTGTTLNLSPIVNSAGPRLSEAAIIDEGNKEGH